MPGASSPRRICGRIGEVTMLGRLAGVTGVVLMGAGYWAQGAVRAQRAPSVDWPSHGNDAGGLKYSPLSDINRSNVSQLDIAFTWSANEQNIPASEGQKPARPGQFQATPIAIHDTLFFPTAFN